MKEEDEVVENLIMIFEIPRLDECETRINISKNVISNVD
jgi:hypothetical protein